MWCNTIALARHGARCFSRNQFGQLIQSRITEQALSNSFQKVNHILLCLAMPSVRLVRKMILESLVMTRSMWCWWHGDVFFPSSSDDQHCRRGMDNDSSRDMNRIRSAPHRGHYQGEREYVMRFFCQRCYAHHRRTRVRCKARRDTSCGSSAVAGSIVVQVYEEKQSYVNHISSFAVIFLLYVQSHFYTWRL